MPIAVLIEEYGEVPSGVVTIVDYTLEKITKNEELVLVCNETFWNLKTFQTKFPKVKVIKVRTFYDCVQPRHLNENNKIGWLSVFFFRLLAKIVYSVLVLWRVYWGLRKYRVTKLLVHNGGWPGGDLCLVSGLAGLLAGINSRVLIVHNLPFKTNSLFSYFYKLLGYCIGGTFHHLVTVSKYCKKELEIFAGLKNIHVIPNGVEQRFSGCSNNRFIQCQNESRNGGFITVGFVGEIHPRKGVHILCEALAIINKPIVCRVFGTGSAEYIDSLKKILCKTSVKLEFNGFESDKNKIFNSIDVLVLPSLEFESFGLVLIEAMTYGVVPICSDFSGMREVVLNGENGFVFEKGNHLDLVSKILKLANDPNLLSQMGQKGPDYVAERFNIENMISSYKRLLEV